MSREAMKALAAAAIGVALGGGPSIVILKRQKPEAGTPQAENKQSQSSFECIKKILARTASTGKYLYFPGP